VITDLSRHLRTKFLAASFRKTFDETGDFAAAHAAEAWCEERGIAVGRMQCQDPRGLMIEDCMIAKWRNLRPHERDTLHGLMTGDMRIGPVVVTIFDHDAESLEELRAAIAKVTMQEAPNA